MSKALSQVQVTIGGKLDPSFQQSFSAADKQQSRFAQHSAELNKKVGDVAAYRRQQNALKDAASEYTKARAKVAALKAEIAAAEAPTRKQAAALAQAERAAARAGAAYTQARTKLSEMARELDRNGVSVGKLSTEYRRLQAELAKANSKQEEHERRLKRQQKLVKDMHNSWRAIGSFIAGSAAAKAVLDRPAAKAVGYDEQIARLAATAGAGKSVSEKEALKAQLSNAVEDARKFSGGATREDVASALNTLVASGKFEDKELPGVLKKVSRTAFASGGSADDIAQLAIALKQFGITDLDTAFDRALKAGQVGRFELKDMAKSLPDQLARARAAGYSGMGGLSDIIAMNQVAMNTAGNADQAGNNMVNLLAKMNSREFNDSIAKAVTVRKGDPTKGGKKGGFDWSTYVQRNRENGINAIESFAMLLERQLEGNKQYQALKKKAQGLPEGGERRETLQSMANIAEGTELGKVMADLQATSAMLARIQGGQRLKEVLAGMNDSRGAVNADAAFLGNQVFANKNLASGALDRANESTFNSMSGALNSTLQGFNSLTESFPKLTTAAYGATTALTAIAAFVGGAGVWRMVTGGSAAAAASSATSTAGAVASAGSKLGILGKLAGPMSIASIANMTSSEEDEELATGPARFEALRAQYGQGTIDAARKKYQPWYQIGKGYAADNEKWVQRYITENGGSAEAAKQAAAAAQTAAQAAQQRPNVTQTFQNSFAVTVNEAKDGKALVPELQRELERINRAQAAAARAGYMGTPEN